MNNSSIHAPSLIFPPTRLDPSRSGAADWAAEERPPGPCANRNPGTASKASPANRARECLRDRSVILNSHSANEHVSSHAGIPAKLLKGRV